MPKFNLPNSDDPDAMSKIITLMESLFGTLDQDIKELNPISSPEDDVSVGSFYFDKADGKIKVKTDAGIKILKYE